MEKIKEWVKSHRVFSVVVVVIVVIVTSRYVFGW